MAGKPLTLGAIFLPQYAPERLRSIASAADAAGLEELWLWEDCFLESGIATAAAALSWTEQLRVGIGILPMPFRNVAITAMELASLDRYFPGRIIAGVGTGVQSWMAQTGVKVGSPLTQLREYIPALRSLLAGEEVTVDGRYVHLDHVKLDWPPARPLSILAAAEGPKTLHLVGEVADGTVLSSGTTPAMVRDARERIDAGRSAAGRSDAHQVVVYLMAATGRGAAERLERVYRKHQLESGADIGVAGDADAVAEAVQRWGDAGADTVVLQPTPDDPDVEGFMEFVARDVRDQLPA